MATTGTKVPSIYKIPSKADPELKQFAESVKEALEVRLGRRGDPRDRAITLRELIDSGLAEELTDNPFDPNVGTNDPGFQPAVITDYTIPPTPTGFTAVATYTSFVLAWDNPQMLNFAYTEIYRHTSNDVTAATRVDTTPAFVWSEEVGYNKTYYYWIRHVSTSEIKGPFTTSSGTAHTDTTSVDIGAVMSSLSESLADLPGYSSLQTADSAVEIIQGTGVPDNNTNRADGTDPHAGDLYLRTSNQQLYIRNTANNAWVECSDDSVVQVIGSTSYTGASLTTAIATAQTDISAQATSISNLTSTVGAKGDIYRASSEPSGGTYVSGDLWVDTDDNQLYQWNGSAWASARDAGLATSTALSSVSSTATTANNTANSKTTTFRQNGTPTAITVGDIWVDTDDGNKMYVATATGTGGWSETTNAQIAAAQSTANSKTKTFRQDDTPTAITVGDVWIDTNDGNKMYIATATGTGGWSEATDAQIATAQSAANAANALAATKITTFRQAGIPTSLAAGDIWIDTDGNNKMYIAEAAGADQITSGEWVDRADSRISTATANITTLQTTTATLTGDAAAAYVLNVNANGSVAGMVIEANASSSGDNVGSAVQFMADKFAIWNATGSGSGSGAVAPFIVDGGVVYIDTARIKDASIAAAKIGSLSANLVNAVNINADSIDSGTLAATRIATTSITTDKLAFGSGTVVTSSGSGANAVLTIVNNGILMDHISQGAIGKVANVVVNNVARQNSTYTFSNLYYMASTPWSEYTTAGKGGGQTSYLGLSSSPVGSLTLNSNTILESGEYLMMAMIQPYGTIASSSASNESALLINVYRSTNGSSWSFWSSSATGTRSGGQGFHLSPLVKYKVWDLSTSYWYRFDLWFHLRGFSNVGGSYGVGEGAISVFRLNKAGSIE